MKIRILIGFIACYSSLLAQPLSTNQIADLANRQLHPALQTLVQFLSIPNVANVPGQMEDNILWMQKACEDRGFTVQRLPNEGHDLVFATLVNNPKLPTLLVYWHIDGQPVDPSKWNQSDPFTPTLKKPTIDGWETLDINNLKQDFDPEWRIFGRSSSDDKSPGIMFFYAMDALKQSGTPIPFNIKIIMDPEEEMGSPHLAAAVSQYRDLLAADRLIILDGPVHPSGKPTLSFGARGIATLAITAYGPKMPLHSGHYGNYAPNPALELAQLLASMKDKNGRVVIPGYYDGIEISTAVRKDLEATPDDAEAICNMLGFSHPDSVGHTLQEALQYPSLNIVGMSCGWVGNQARTIVPADATANLDMRLVKESDPVRLLGLVRQWITDQGYHICDGPPTDEERAEYGKLVSFSSEISYNAFRTDLGTPIDLWLTAALTQAHGEKPVRIRTGGGSVPISPFVETLKMPAVLVPLVNGDNNQHSPNENLRLGNFLDGIKSCIAILQQPWE
ncbi:MAG: M20/M25/M40 family metallo-hydrolase [Saprospiraceae bacterium]|nr:M20/M25/M40 family metallo-hydrolase [Saprospiraceae bacterium]